MFWARGKDQCELRRICFLLRTGQALSPEICCDQYDFIIIDTPPVLVVPDAVSFSQNADANSCFRNGTATNRAWSKKSMRFFHNSNQRIIGLGG